VFNIPWWSSHVRRCSFLRCNPVGAVLLDGSFLLLSRDRVAKIPRTGEKLSSLGDGWNVKPATWPLLVRWWRDQSERWRDSFNHRVPKAAPRLLLLQKNEPGSAHACRARCKPGILAQLSSAVLSKKNVRVLLRCQLLNVDNDDLSLELSWRNIKRL